MNKKMIVHNHNVLKTHW